ncbi:MAG: hypothetical protein PVJ67_00210 [Candidatus Pacearchaeota archaeon]|jgi:hypothetical protein
MELNRDELIFAEEVLYLLYNKGIKSFPFKTRQYHFALKKIKNDFEKKRELNFPLDFLLTLEPITGEFPRMYAAIMRNLGECAAIKSPYFNEITFDSYSRRIQNFLVKGNPLVEKFTKSFIKELKLC